MADLGSAFMAPLVANQQMMERQALLPSELAQKAASSRYTAALADKVETETKADKSVAAQLTALANGGQQDGTVSGRLLTLSDAYLKAGEPSKAATLAQQASQAQAHEATTRKAEFEKALAQSKMGVSQLQQGIKLLGGVTDQSSWDEANATFEKSTGQKSPFADIPYDPKMVQVLKDSGTSEYQKQELKLKAQGLAIHASDVASKLSTRATATNIKMEQLRVTQQREERLAKAGGKDVGAPNGVEVKAAARLIGDQLEGDEKDAAAFSVASEAKALRRKNPGMSADEAMRKALSTAQAQGNFVPATNIPFYKPGTSSPGKFVTPQILPKSAGGLTKGQHYVMPNGAIGSWNGKSFDKVAAGKAAAPSGGDDEEDDDDE